MPYCCAMGRISRSMPRSRIEYAGCSVRRRCSPRDSAIHWASTMVEAGKADEPMARTLPLRTRSVRADRVSSRSAVRVGAVELVEVDVVGAQPAQRVFDGGHDPTSGGAALVGVVAHGP